MTNHLELLKSNLFSVFRETFSSKLISLRNTKIILLKKFNIFLEKEYNEENPQDQEKYVQFTQAIEYLNKEMKENNFEVDQNIPSNFNFNLNLNLKTPNIDSHEKIKTSKKTHPKCHLLFNKMTNIANISINGSPSQKSSSKNTNLNLNNSRNNSSSLSLNSTPKPEILKCTRNELINISNTENIAEKKNASSSPIQIRKHPKLEISNIKCQTVKKHLKENINNSCLTTFSNSCSLKSLTKPPAVPVRAKRIKECADENKNIIICKVPRNQGIHGKKIKNNEPLQIKSKNEKLLQDIINKCKTTINSPAY